MILKDLSASAASPVLTLTAGILRSWKALPLVLRLLSLLLLLLSTLLSCAAASSVAPFSPSVMMTRAADDTTRCKSCCDHVLVSTSDRNRCTRLLRPACSIGIIRHSNTQNIGRKFWWERRVTGANWCCNMQALCHQPNTCDSTVCLHTHQEACAGLWQRQHLAIVAEVPLEALRHQPYQLAAIQHAFPEPCAAAETTNGRICPGELFLFAYRWALQHAWTESRSCSNASARDVLRSPSAHVMCRGPSRAPLHLLLLTCVVSKAGCVHVVECQRPQQDHTRPAAAPGHVCPRYGDVGVGSHP